MPNAATINAARPKCHNINKKTGFWCGLPLRLRTTKGSAQMYHCPVHGMDIGVDRNPTAGVRPEAVMV